MRNQGLSARRRAAAAPRVLALAAVAAVAPLAASAQVVTIRGVAWDSLRAEPLVGAMVSVVGTGRSAIADSRGRFQIDSVSPGAYTIQMTHEAIDSIGLTGVSRKYDVLDGRAELRLALPSFATFWQVGCSGRPPRDSSLVYGTVRKPGSGAPVAGAKVELAWLDIASKGRREVQQQMKRLDTRTDSTGAYGFCGVPAGAGFRMRASTDSSASGIIDMLPNMDRVRWRDLAVGPLVDNMPSAVGSVAGVVVRGASGPMADARVVLDDVGEVRTDSAGRFAIGGVPSGTRQLQVLGVGLNPVTQAVDVKVGDTTRVYVNVDRITTLGAVRVTGTPFMRRLMANLEYRRSQGLGTFVDSTAIVGLPLMRSALSVLPSVKLVGKGRIPIIETRAGCVPAVWIDGVDQRGQETIWSLYPDEIALIEIYPSRATLPAEFEGTRRSCGAIAVWTKRAIRP